MPATRDADDAFAELTARLRSGSPPAPPAAAASLPREPAPPPPRPPPSAPAAGLAAPAPVAQPPTGRPLPPTPPRPRRATAQRQPGPDVPDAEIESLEIHLRRAAPWRRAAAWAVDAVPFATACAALVSWLAGQAAGASPGSSGIEGSLDLLASEQVTAASIAGALFLAIFSYATLAHALGGATLGKWLLHLKVVGPDGARPSLTRSAARSALAGLSFGLLGLGFLLALFTRTGRALHDLAARTWVVEAP
jgi:uncharacterized RDD family membrane protein YckC